jgi:autotransporter-associated beta strand protein
MKQPIQKIMIRPPGLAILLGLLTLLGAEFTRAAVYTWTSTTGGTTTTDGAGTWAASGSLNWRLNNAGTAVAWVNNNDAIFGGNSGAAGTITLSGAPVVNNVTFQAAGSGNYGFSSSQLRIGSAANQIVTWTINPGVAPDVGNGGSSGTNLREGGGNNGIIITGGGTLLLTYTGSTTPYTGPTTIQGGTTLYVGAGFLLAGASNILTSGTLGSFNSAVRVFTKPTALKGNFTLGAPSPRNGNLTFTNTTTWQLSGGTWTLTVDTITVTNNSVIVEDGSSRGLTFASVNGGKLILNNTESYTGPTTINSGALALGASGVLNAASGVSLAAGATFDVSALTTYTLGGSATLSASGTGTTVGTTAANIKGGTTVDLGTRPIALTFTPTGLTGDTTHPALLLESGTLSLGGNAFTVNNAAAAPLGAGVYRLIQTGGSITTAGLHTVNVTGNGLGVGLSAAIQVNNTIGMVDLVVTTSCTPGNDYAVTGGGTICAGDPGAAMGLSGSDTGVDYQLKRNGSDVGSPVAGTGAVLDFGLQTVAGTYLVVASNTATFCTGNMVGSAVVTVNNPPGISTQPVAATVPLGGSTNFSVVATGTGLTYQWRHDGTNLSNGGSISGATSGVLTINPVAAGDSSPALNGYDCVISGTCPPTVTSDRVALTVLLPKNLTWVGDGSANLWNTSTPNWTGDATVFSANDLVTFDNSGSASPAIDLVGVISPATITVNSSQNYTFGSTSGGSLGGSAALTKSGSGKLTLATVNAFTGKTAVTGGTVSITNAINLGTAPGAYVADQLTLNGGALEFTVSGGISANRGVTLGASGGTIKVPSGILFTNTPIITGAGSLTKVDTGTLTLPGANSYLGGTVVSNGTLVALNAGSLGSGTATLAGGTLSFPAATTIANSLAVTENSTLTFATTGNSAVVLNGTGFTGVSGKTLTVTPTGASTTATRVRVNSGLTNSFTFDANLNLNGIFTWATYNNVGDEIYNGIISGAGTLGRRSPLAGTAGRTILNGDNTYTGGTVIADGAIGFGIDSTGSPTVTSGPVGTGAITPENNANTLHRLYASGGARTVGNAITWPAGVNQDLIIEGANALTLNGAMDLGAATRTLAVNNSANTTLGGVISNGGLVKTGPGVLLLNGINTYTSSTTVSNGVLGGTGTLASALIVDTAGTLSPGVAGLGTFTVNGDLTLLGNTAVDINKTAVTSDLVTGISTANYGGTLTINNLAGTLAASDSFTLFSATTHTGSFSSFSPATPGAGLAWSFTNGVLSVVSAVVTPPTLNMEQSGSTLTFSWTGSFKLQSQTNTLGIGLTGTWFDYPSGGSSPVNITVNPGNPSVFYRLSTP